MYTEWVATSTDPLLFSPSVYSLVIFLSTGEKRKIVSSAIVAFLGYSFIPQIMLFPIWTIPTVLSTTPSVTCSMLSGHDSYGCPQPCSFFFSLHSSVNPLTLLQNTFRIWPHPESDLFSSPLLLPSGQIPDVSRSRVKGFADDHWVRGTLLTWTQFSSVQSLSHVRLCDPMDCSMPGLPVHHQLPEFTQILVHWVGDAIQPSHPLSSPSPPAFNLSQHQGLFKWISSSHQVAKILEFQLQHQSFQWIFRTDFL